MRLVWGEFGAWQPQGARETPVRDLAVGDLIEADRALLQVTGTRDVPVAEWDDTDREHYERYVMPSGPGLHRKPETGRDGRPVPPEAWSLRPVYVAVRPAAGGPGQRLRCRPYAFKQASAYVIPEHHPVCAGCGELYPCKHLEIDQEAEAGLAELEGLESILPGCCWHCREPVTRLQKSIRFDGDNLLLPGATPPVFHLRQGDPYCHSAALRYEKRWVAADPARLPRLHCPGLLVKHVDGHECSAGDRCPGPAANHLAQRSHQQNPSAMRDCPRCADACARRGIRFPAAPRSNS